MTANLVELYDDGNINGEAISFEERMEADYVLFARGMLYTVLKKLCKDMVF